jgi:perosamine synthetase
MVVDVAKPRALATASHDYRPLSFSVRRYPPVASPLSAIALLVATRDSLVDQHACRAELTRRLQWDYRADDVLLTATGTAALQLAIRMAMDLTSCAVVALPAWTCYDVATAAVGADASIVLYDVDPDTLAPDPDSFQQALRLGAKSAVVASLYGLGPDWDTLTRVAAAHGALLIEDAAQGHGGTWRGRPLGSLGCLSVLSFGRGKGWTGGSGGALLCRGVDVPLPGLPAPSRGGRVFTAAAAQWFFGRPALFALPAALPWLRLGETVYRPPSPPAPITSLAAALLLATREDSLREARRRQARVDDLLELIDGVPTPDPDAAPGWLRLPVRLPPTAAAQTVLRLRALGVSAGYPSTLADLPAVRARMLPAAGASASQLPGATALAAELITLPTHGQLRPHELAHVINVVTTARRRTAE